MGETEVRTADGSGQVRTQSAQTDPKSKADKATPAKRAGSNAPQSVKPKLNERGVPVTNWDNPKNDPNKREHVGNDPEGKKNKLS
jgi:hypothetical protein